MDSRRAVLLTAFGGPTKADEIRPFLDNVLRGRPVPKERYEEVVRQYEQIGGASPLNVLTFNLARAVENNLRGRSSLLPVYIGMRNWVPYIGDTLRIMKEDGVREAAVVVLSSFRSEPSWDRYVQAVRDGDPGGIKFRYAEPWQADPRFIQAVADRILEAQTALPEARRKNATWVFTAHSIPKTLDVEYSQELARSAALCAARLGHGDWQLAYQSRSGRPEDPWLEPDIGDVLARLDSSEHKDVLAVPLGFLMDHVEVLYDLDVKAKTVAEQSGLNFIRAKTVGTHDSFLDLLADRVLTALEAVPRR